MTFTAWRWSADFAEQLPLYGSVGTGLAFLLALCIRWWHREDDNIATERRRSTEALEAERARYDRELAEVKEEHHRAMRTMIEKTDRMERALGHLLRASDDPDVRRAVTVALWPEGKPEGRGGRRGRNDGP